MTERVGNLSRKIKATKKEPDGLSRTEKYIPEVKNSLDDYTEILVYLLY